MIEILASEIGVFDGKVKELFSIFAKYKDIIFRNGAVGLPPLRRKNIIEAQLKQGLDLAADQAKRALGDALKQGASIVKDVAKSGEAKMSKAAVEGVVAWISSLVILINKNTAQLDMEFFKETFKNSDGQTCQNCSWFCTACRG